MSDRLRERTEPTAAEVESLRRPVPPEILRVAASATAPLPRERAALERRLRAPAPARPRLVPVTAGILALAAALLLLLGRGPERPEAREEVAKTAEVVASEPAPELARQVPEAPPAPVASEQAPPAEPPAPRVATPSPGRVADGATFALSAAPMHLNPAIQVGGQGLARLLARGPGGSVLALDSGRLQVEVDPSGEERKLAVVAGDVTVEVVGTLFTVERDGDRVAVEVTRGRVRVVSPDGTRELGAGERWTNADPPDAAARAYAALAARAAAGERDDLLWTDLSAFEAAWPGSPLASEAALLRLSQQAEVLPTEAVVAELDLWLARWPGAPSAEEAHWLRATLLRAELQDCARAASSYAVLAAGEGPRAAAAREWLAACAGR